MASEPTTDPMPVFALKGKDALAPDIIDAYHRECCRIGIYDQAAEVQAALEEMAAWQARHPEAVKLPDHKHVPATVERESLNVPPEPHAQDAERRDELATLRARVSELLAQIVASESAAFRRLAHADGYAEAIRNLRDLAGYKRWHAQQLADTGVDHHRFHATARRVLADYLEAVAGHGPQPDYRRTAGALADELTRLAVMSPPQPIGRCEQCGVNPAYEEFDGRKLCVFHIYDARNPRHPTSPVPGYRPDGTPIGTLE